jgi:prefoldin subunit 5
MSQVSFEVNQLEYEKSTLEKQSEEMRAKIRKLEKSKLELESQFNTKLNEAND